MESWSHGITEGHVKSSIAPLFQSGSIITIYIWFMGGDPNGF